MQKFPLVRIKQFLSNPTYIFFWLKRVFFYKKNSYKNMEEIFSMQQYSPSQTLSYIIESKCSIIRFGDGEFGLLSGAGIFPPDSDWSQRYSSELKSEIQRQLSISDKKILIALPPKEHLLYKEGADSPKLDVISSMHIEARLFLGRYIKHEQVYGDWSVFMPHHHKGLDWQKIKSYFSDKTIVIVTGGTSALQDIKLGHRTLFVEAGKHDAFSRRLQIMADIEDLIIRENLNPHKTLFLISLGCTAGVVVEYLSGKNFIAWDTGHIFRFARNELNKL